MDKVWCGWEEAEFDRELFKPYHEGPLLEHLDVKPRHTNNGIEIGQPGPEPRDAAPGGDVEIGQSRSTSVTYGYGPMARRPDDL